MRILSRDRATNMTQTPLYHQVYNELKERIEAGRYDPRAALPSEAKLGDEFGVSSITVRRALRELALDGIVERRQGIGSFVVEPGRTVVVGMSSFTSDVASGRLRIVRTLLADESVPAVAEMAEKLEVQAGSMLRHLVRLDCEGGAPLSVDEVLIPPALAQGITPRMAASPVFLHLWQKQSGRHLVRTHYDIRVETASEDDRRLLQIDGDVPLLVTGELIHTAEGRPALWIVIRYRGDRSRLAGTVTLVQRQTRRGTVGE